MYINFFFSSRRRHTRYWRDWSSDVCSSDLSFKIVQLPLTAEVARPVSVETVPSWAAAEPLSSRVSFISTTATEPLAAQTPAAYPWPVDQVGTASRLETSLWTRSR